MNKFKMYIFARTKDKNGKKFSKGKLAGQVGHVCARMGQYVNQIGDNDFLRYMMDGEIKLVFKVDELPLIHYHPLYKTVETYWYDEHPMKYEQYSSTVKDTTTGEYIALAVLTKEKIDTTGLKLL